MGRAFDLTMQQGEPLAVPTTTGRLNVVRASQPLTKAEANNRADFAKLLKAHVPESWPPPFVKPAQSNDSSQWHNFYLTKMSSSP